MSRAPSLKRNTLANYVGQAYTTFIGIVIFPFYMGYMGAEAYGLVGFFMVLQTWLGMLDMGLTPMLNREVATARAQGNTFITFRKLLRSVELIFAGFGLVAAISIGLLSPWLAAHWLHPQTLSLSTVAACIALMGIMVGFRFFTSVYKSGLSGMEAQIRLNILNITIATFRAFGAWGLLHFVDASPLSFFLYQLVISVAEPLILGVTFYRHLPASPSRTGLRFSWGTLKPALPFGMSVAYTSAIWTVLTQLDKLILSGLLPLKQYGYFALIAIVSTGVMQVATPISNALLPRMTYLLSSGQEDKMLGLYRTVSQLVAVIMLPLTGMVGLFGAELVYAWTGNHEAATWTSPILFWYMLGNAVLSILAFQYYLQYAHGKLRLHVQMNTLLVCIAAPCILITARLFGPLGTGIAWFALQLGCFLVWPPLIHRKFAPGLHLRWLVEDILPIALWATTGLLVVRYLLPVHSLLNTLNRPLLFMALVGLGLVALGFAAGGSSALRQRLITSIKRT